MQWFSSGSGPSSSAAPSSSQPSLLAEWNSYAAARSADDAGDGFGIDIEAAVRSANDRVAGTFGVCRLPFTAGFVGSMVATIYVSMVLHSYILSVFFSVLQVLALGYYAISYFPGGSAGMKFLSSALVSSVLRCFGR
nr:unnamed protein product [Digitaria exilis]